MTTNLAIDDALINEALTVGHFKTKLNYFENTPILDKDFGFYQQHLPIKLYSTTTA